MVLLHDICLATFSRCEQRGVSLDANIQIADWPSLNSLIAVPPLACKHSLVFGAFAFSGTRCGLEAFGPCGTSCEVEWKSAEEPKRCPSQAPQAQGRRIIGALPFVGVLLRGANRVRFKRLGG
jgi:hypothetical protein